MAVFPIRTPDQKAMMGVCISFAILPVIAVGLRLLAHRIAQKKWTPGDYLLIAACFFGVGLQLMSIASVIYGGVGYGHTKDITREYGPGPLDFVYKIILPMEVFWLLTLCLTKMSILYLYLRIFPIPWVTYCSYAVMALVTAWTVAILLVCLLICQPFRFHWDKTIPGGHCGNQPLVYMIFGVANVVTNIMVLILPMYPIS
ncbi:hypothetical protein ACJQWK_06409 [Exserohilum turcicum]